MLVDLEDELLVLSKDKKLWVDVHKEDETMNKGGSCQSMIPGCTDCVKIWVTEIFDWFKYKKMVF
jgi:hypothetical protein